MLDSPRFAPSSRNCSASVVFPTPGSPSTSRMRPEGKPPRTMSSRPAIPVAAFGWVIGAQFGVSAPPVYPVARRLTLGARHVGRRNVLLAARGQAPQRLDARQIQMPPLAVPLVRVRVAHPAFELDRRGDGGREVDLGEEVVPHGSFRLHRILEEVVAQDWSRFYQIFGRQCRTKAHGAPQ